MKINSLFLFSLTLVSYIVAESKIINGDIADQFAYPFVVSLQNNLKPFCGGSILDQNSILTAAHCSYDSVTNLTVSIHRHDLKLSADQEQGINIKVKSITNHPLYNVRKLINDISVWKLSEPIPSTIVYKTVKLDTIGLNSKVGLNTTLIGWGRTDPSVTDPNPILRQAILPIYEFESCNFGYLNTLDSSHHVCAGYKEGIRSGCNGDSGGPLFVIHQSEIVQVGIASFVALPSCIKRNQPTVFSRVESYIQFIKMAQNAK